jgi:hypothetical protein
LKRESANARENFLAFSNDQASAIEKDDTDTRAGRRPSLAPGLNDVLHLVAREVMRKKFLGNY